MKNNRETHQRKKLNFEQGISSPQTLWSLGPSLFIFCRYAISLLVHSDLVQQFTDLRYGSAQLNGSSHTRITHTRINPGSTHASCQCSESFDRSLKAIMAKDKIVYLASSTTSGPGVLLDTGPGSTQIDDSGQTSGCPLISFNVAKSSA